MPSETGRLSSSAFAADYLARLCGAVGSVPVEAIQTLFLILDPFAAERKFIRFAALDPEGDEARRFVALEDWVNDGVPLALGVARNCGCSWYTDNDPGRGVWRVAGQPVLPQSLRRPPSWSCPAAIELSRRAPPNRSRQRSAGQRCCGRRLAMSE